MPYRWTEPDPFFHYKGVTVYFIYKNDDEEQGTRRYAFTTNPDAGDESDEEDGVFDIRDLPGYREPESTRRRGMTEEEDRAAFWEDFRNEREAAQKIIEAAIDSGRIKKWEK
jgi:hypothetical protein